MPLILDTYNVLHVTGVLPPDLAGIDVGELIAMIRASRYRREHATLVIDGTKHPGVKQGTDGRVTIRFSGPGFPADNVIMQIIRESSVPRRLIVVSSDRAIMKAARQRRCIALGSDEFLTQLVHDLHRGGIEQHTSNANAGSSPTNAVAPVNVDKWINLFGIDAQAVEQESKAAANEALATPTADDAEDIVATTPGKPEQPQITPLPVKHGTERVRPTPAALVEAESAPPAPAVVPDDILAQAEQLLNEPFENRVQPHVTARKSRLGDSSSPGHGTQ